MQQPTPPLLEGPESAFLLLFVQVFLLVCLFLALIFNVPDLTLFSLFMLTIGLGSYFWSRVGLNHIQCNLALTRRRFFPDEKLTLDIRVANSKLLPVLIKVDIFIPQVFTGSDTGRWVSEEAGLLWYQKTVFSRSLFPNRRGVYNLGPPRLRGSDLFGFYFREKTALEQAEIVVYPRIIKVARVGLPKREFFGTPGAHSPVEDPVFIFGTRDYQPGRPARGIHWKTSARHNRLQEKLCEPAEQEKILFILDVDRFEAENGEERFEKTLEVIASLVLQLDRRGIAVGFITNGHITGGKPKIVPLSRSPRQIASVLETLARVSLEATRPVTEIVSRGYRIPWGTSGIYFCHEKSHETRRAKLFMKNINIPTRFVVAQPSNDKRMVTNTDTICLDQIWDSKDRN